MRERRDTQLEIRQEQSQREPARNPFLGDMLEGQRTAFLYKQSRDYAAEDALALIELARAVPHQHWERVSFLPILSQVRFSFSLKEILIAPQGSESTDVHTSATNELRAFVKKNEQRELDDRENKIVEWFAPLVGDSISRLDPRKGCMLEMPDAPHLVIIGRPQYFSAWWTAWWDQFNKDGESDENRLEAQGWFNSLIDRAGYCARYMIPYNSQHPIFSNEPDDGLYDRKWGVRYSVTPTAKGGVKPPTGKDDAKPSTGKDDAKLQDDFALIFQNIVELGGIRRRITICTGLGPLGTWAAARFVADPALWGQLRDVHTVREDEGPIEVAIRARFIDDCRPPHLGPYQMSLSRIQILNNHPSEYLGQVCRLKKDNRRQLDGGPSIYSKVDETRHDHRVLDLGHQIRALRFLLGEDRETLTKLDPSVQNDSVDEIDEFLELIWDHVETPTAKWKELRPRCCFEKSKNNGKKNDVRLKGAIWTWDEGKKICTGPRLFTVLWELLNEVQEAGNDFQSRKLPLTPLLLRGNSGSGKEPLVEAVRWAYRWFLEQRNGSSLKPELFAEVVNVAALGSEVKTLKELLEKILTKYLSDPGVLFLDEFSDFTSINEQVSLLRLLQDGKVDVTNGDPTPHRALILAATSQPLEELTNEDVVREDLLYRFKTTWLPPLKERIIDAVFLLVFFWLEDDGWTKNDRPKTLDISLPALKLFLSHSFDGNVRLLMREIIPRLKRLYRQQGNTNPKCVNFDLMRRSLGTVGAPDTAVLEEFEETLICFSIDPPSDLKTLLEQINGGDSDQAVASQ